MKVKVELMNMDSDPGYVPSSGHTDAVLVSAEDAARCGGDSDALFDLGGDQITVEMLEDVEKRTARTGVLNYHTTTGVFDVTEGKVVVQKNYENICTSNGASYNAWIVEPQSLRKLYEKRAAAYKRLAQLV